MDDDPRLAKKIPERFRIMAESDSTADSGTSAKMSERERHQRIKEVFLELSELPKEAWKEGLERLCPADLELQSAVAELLGFHSEDTLIVPAQRLEAGALAEVEAPLLKKKPRQEPGRFGRLLSRFLPSLFSDRSAMPKKLGAYRIERKLSEGGMAEVFLGVHEKLGRVAALKKIFKDLADPEMLRRFDREAKAISRLEHVNTVRLYDYGETEHGDLYIAMEYVDGLTLAELVGLAGALAPARALDLLLQCCESLSEAHRQHIVHRDIKPANVMVLGKEPVFDRVKVLDFGLARGGAVEASVAVTRQGYMLGTPHYIAPERFEDPNELRPSQDVYSLGALGYFLLSGNAPFSSTSEIIAIQSVLAGLPPEPLDELHPDIPQSVCELINRCMLREPELRPKDAGDLADRIKQLREAEPSLNWDQKMAKKWWLEQIAKELS